MMLDTIALTLDRHEFEVLDPGRFSPSARGLLTPPYYALGGRGNFSCIQNPTKAELKAGLYRPRLTLTKRKTRGGFNLALRIEFSAPKLVFGNNFDELTSRDFDRVLAVLRRSLSDMGIRVDEYMLRAARVSAVHYSKNIAFTDFTSCSMVMSDLDLIDLNQRLDLSHTDYRNEGHAVRYHANSFEVTFYDKMKDLQKARYSEMRAVESDYGPQLEFFDEPSAFPRQLEVLRMEVRLGTRTKIKNVLEQVGSNAEPTFAALFDISLAKDVLLHFWTHIRCQLPLLQRAAALRPEDLLESLATEAEGSHRPGTLLQQVGFLMLVGSIGVRGAGAVMCRHCNPRTWQRYKRQLRDLELPECGGFNALMQVDEALRQFEPLRMSTFKLDQPLAMRT